MTNDPVLALALRPRIIDAVCSVYDPEIPVNIWELGSSTASTSTANAVSRFR